MSQEFDLVGRVIGCAMAVHRALGSGFLEVIYRNALCIEPKQNGISYAVEEPIRVKYKGIEVGSYMADIFIEGQFIVELKAVVKLAATHEVQIVNYLTATNITTDSCSTFAAEVSNIEGKREPFRNAPLPPTPNFV